LRRNCLLKDVIEGKWEGRIDMTGRRRRRRKQLLDDFKENRRYCKLKEEAVDRTLWRTRFGIGYGPVVRQTTEWMNEWMNKYLILSSILYGFCVANIWILVVKIVKYVRYCLNLVKMHGISRVETGNIEFCTIFSMFVTSVWSLCLAVCISVCTKYWGLFWKLILNGSVLREICSNIALRLWDTAI
jgi:hypothetical protein